MTIDEIRKERTKLEAEILRLCKEFTVRTGLCVVALGAETFEVQRMGLAYGEKHLERVRVATEQI